MTATDHDAPHDDAPHDDAAREDAAREDAAREDEHAAGDHPGNDGTSDHAGDHIGGAQLPRRAPLLPGWEAADAAARQVGDTVTHGDQLLCWTRQTLVWLHAPARTVALALGFGLAVWAGATLRLGWPEPRAWVAGLATAVVLGVLIAVSTAIARRAEPRRRVDLILAPDATELRWGLAGGGVTRRDVDAGVQLAVRECRAAGRLVLDTSSATRLAAMRPEDIHEVLVAGLGRVDEVLVVAPAGILTAGMRTLVRTAIRRGVPVSCWHHDPRTPGSGLAGTR